MHLGIMEALETRARDITMGIMKEKMHDRQNMKDIALGNLSEHWRKGRSHVGKGSSYIKSKRKHLPIGDIQVPQNSLMESSS